MAFLAFLMGQIAVIIVSYAWWRQPDNRLLTYLSKKMWLHIGDGIVAFTVFLAWGTGTLADFMKLVGLGDMAGRIPNLPAGSLIAYLCGVACSVAAMVIHKWTAKKMSD